MCLCSRIRSYSAAISATLSGVVLTLIRHCQRGQ